MKSCKALLLSACLASLAACHPGANSGSSSSTATDNIATVNGTGISRSLFDFYLKNAMQRQNKEPATATQQQKDEILDTLVRAELIVQQADKDGLTKDPDTQDMLELSRMNALQQAFSERFAKENKPTEEELKKEYDVQVAKLQHTEYHVEHILVPNADAANAIIAQLNKGAKFEDLAKKQSSDSSKDQGGDLGWMTPDRIAKPFADAMVALKPGEYTHVPVQTQYGWHVIKLLDTRPLAPPDYAKVKDQINQIVLNNKFKAYVDGLIAKSQIDKKM
ncbi:MAG TPA: peptidylprolyl isomerase [Steroidobacteraceae bacterium]|nr:peptidylprolyl isomerase [Steroidobacteraceae bacterium]